MCVDQACRTYEWVMSHHEWVIPNFSESHIINESRHTLMDKSRDTLIANAWSRQEHMSHTHVCDESCRTSNAELVLSHSDVTHSYVTHSYMTHSYVTHSYVTDLYVTHSYVTHRAKRCRECSFIHDSSHNVMSHIYCTASLVAHPRMWWVMSYIWMSHVANSNQSYHTYTTRLLRHALSSICRTFTYVMSHVILMNASCLTFEWVMSHIWMSRIPCHTFEWVVPHSYDTTTQTTLRARTCKCTHTIPGYPHLYHTTTTTRTFADARGRREQISARGYLSRWILHGSPAGVCACVCVCMCVFVCVCALCADVFVR